MSVYMFHFYKYSTDLCEIWFGGPETGVEKTVWPVLAHSLYEAQIKC